MTHAENDLVVAKTLSGVSDAHTGARDFHAQQAAEKAIRAAITVSGKEPRLTHDLVILARNLPPG